MGIKYEASAEKVLTGLKGFEDSFSKERYIEFENKLHDMKNTVQEFMKDNRPLKIGVVGEVKAGKSSFINALVFDGKNVLPKAATPMTAALTKISYTDEPYASIVFYSENDWKQIEEIANEYDSKFSEYYDKCVSMQNTMGVGNIFNDAVVSSMPIISKEELKRAFNETVSSELVSCKELKEMFDNSDADLMDWLGKSKELKLDDIESDLSEYIGANGKFTPIVKHVELKINNNKLKDIEIVDTPGLNDPIISRGETTKKFLGKCDVIFLLSYCGQFLTESDISFMRDTLPREGISNAEVVIVGSKLDSGILDYNKSKDIRTAYNSSIRIYNNQANVNIEKCMESGYRNDILERIYDSLPPSYISSMMFSCAKKKKTGVQYSKEEEHIIKQLKKRFVDFDDTSKMLLSLSGINQLKKNKISPIKNKKDDIIKNKNREIVSGNKKQLINILDDIDKEASHNLNMLKNCSSEEDVEKKFSALLSKLDSIRTKVPIIFNNYYVEASKQLNKIKNDIESEIENYQDPRVISNTDKRDITIQTGLFGWMREHRTEEVVTYTAAISDVISNMRGYINKCKRYADMEFKHIVSLRGIRNDIKSIAMAAFDLSDRNFDENDIILPMENAINKISIPKIDIEVSDFENLIIEQFEDVTVKNEEIDKLRLAATRAFNEISKKFKSELDKCGERLEKVMNDQALNFVNDITKQLSKNAEIMKEQIEGKEKAICKYSKLLEELNVYRQTVREMEL